MRWTSSQFPVPLPVQQAIGVPEPVQSTFCPLPGSPRSSTFTRKATVVVFLPPVALYSPTPEKQARFAGARRGSGPQIRSPGLHRLPVSPTGDEHSVPPSQPHTKLLKSLAWKLPCCFL